MIDVHKSLMNNIIIILLLIFCFALLCATGFFLLALGMKITAYSDFLFAIILGILAIFMARKISIQIKTLSENKSYVENSEEDS